MQMKGALLALVEAVRLSRLELSIYRDERYRATPEWTVERLAKLLEADSVDAAMALVAPDAESPSIVPRPEEKLRKNA
jgi:hypothetical protein